MKKEFLFFSLLLISACLLYIDVCVWKARETGESRTFVMATQTLLSSGTLSYTKTDEQVAAQTFGKFISSTRTRYRYSDKSFLHRFATIDAKNPDYVGRCHYWGTYSFFCIPLYWVCKALHLFSDNMFNVFKVCNIVLLLIPLLVIVFVLKKNVWHKCGLLLVCLPTPAMQYLSWASAECFIYSCVTLCMLFAFDRRYYLSAIALALGSTMNLTLFPVSVALFSLFAYEKRDLIFARRWKQLLLSYLCFVLCFLPVVHCVGDVYLQYGKLVTMGASPFLLKMQPLLKQFYWHRVFAYLFDLNFGAFIHYHVLFVLSFLLIPIACIRKKYWYVVFWGAYIATVMSYSLMFHVDCGMEGAHRYVIWSAPILILACCELLFRLTKKSISFFFIGAYACISVYLGLFPMYTNYLNHGTVASYVLKHFPRFYNPLYSTFISRIKHIDGSGAYLYDSPVVHIGKDKAKVLLTKNNVDDFYAHLKGRGMINKFYEDDFKKILYAEPGMLSKIKQYYYVDFPLKYYGFKDESAKFSDSFEFEWFSGLYREEPWGRWSYGDVQLSLLDKETGGSSQARTLSLALRTCIGNNELDVYCNGRKLAKWVVDEKLKEYCVELPVSEDGHFAILIKQKKLVRPCDVLKDCADSRKLGVAFHAMRVGCQGDALTHEPEPLDANSVLFSKHDERVVLQDGFAVAEPWGVWSTAPTFSMRVTIPKLERDAVVNICAQAYKKVTSVRVFFNDEPVAEWNVPDGRKREYAVRIPQKFSGHTGVLRFEQKEIVSPHELNPKDGDVRKLGLGLISLNLVKDLKK